MRGFSPHDNDLDHAEWLNGPEGICEDRPPNLCEHGINIDQAGCGRCLEQEILDGLLGQALATRFSTKEDS